MKSGQKTHQQPSQQMQQQPMQSQEKITSAKVFRIQQIRKKSAELEG